MKALLIFILFGLCCANAQDLDFHIAQSKINDVKVNRFTIRQWDDFQKEHRRYFSRVNRGFEYWNDLDRMNDLWGYTSAGFYLEESNKAKREVLKTEFLNYLTYRVKRNRLRDELDVWRMGLRRDYEIDQRSMLVSGKTFTYDGRRLLGPVKKRGKKKQSMFKVNFKPHLFRGLLVTSVKSKWLDTHLLTGINKEVELRVSRKFSRLKLRVGSDYDFFNKRLLSYVDKSFGRHLRTRISAEKFFNSKAKLTDSLYATLNFFKRF